MNVKRGREEVKGEGGGGAKWQILLCVSFTCEYHFWETK